ncbi:hypothetical protein EON66_02265 [archaeon]|nr:MAG: hypothetical protein EON66_02265 [archaeon]
MNSCVHRRARARALLSPGQSVTLSHCVTASFAATPHPTRAGSRCTVRNLAQLSMAQLVKVRGSKTAEHTYV